MEGMCAKDLERIVNSMPDPKEGQDPLLTEKAFWQTELVAQSIVEEYEAPITGEVFQMWLD